MSKILKFYFSGEGKINKYQFNMGLCALLTFTMMVEPVLFQSLAETIVQVMGTAGVVIEENLFYDMLYSFFGWMAIGLLYYCVLVLMKKRFADLKMDREIKSLLFAPFTHQTWSMLYERS